MVKIPQLLTNPYKVPINSELHHSHKIHPGHNVVPEKLPQRARGKAQQARN